MCLNCADLDRHNCVTERIHYTIIMRLCQNAYASKKDISQSTVACLLAHKTEIMINGKSFGDCKSS